MFSDCYNIKEKSVLRNLNSLRFSQTNAEVEWKFSRAVVENQYRNLHSTVVPFNLLSVPLESLYCKVNGDSRKEVIRNFILYQDNEFLLTDLEV